MTRITKDHEERRSEILNTAQRLFIEKGFIRTSVSEIVKEIGVAQGTFYYYFKTKEDILNAIIERYTDELTSEAAACMDHPDWDFKKKLEGMALAEIKVNLRNFGYLHRIQEADIHTRIVTALVGKLTPFYTRIIEEGIRSGDCKTDYPQEHAESMIVTAHILFDPGLFHWTKDEFGRLITSFIDSLEKTLGIEKGVMAGYQDIMMQIYKRL